MKIVIVIGPFACTFVLFLVAVFDVRAVLIFKMIERSRHSELAQ